MYSYETKIQSTDSFVEGKENCKVIEFPYDKFLISIVVDENNKFLGINKVKINQNFYSNNVRNVHDFDEYLREIE